jgi:tungstate transport system ATP-binding protein
MRPIYELTALKQVYAAKTVLEIGQLSIRAGSIVGLIGPNGSGKSTLLRLMGLIEKPHSGNILFNGQPVEPFSPEARFQISLLPQEPFLLKRSVSGNVAYGLKLRGDTGSLTEKIDRVLSIVGLDGGRFRHRPWYALSGGETQRVALAARLALSPRVLLMDEPTASVDAASAQRIKEAALRARNELGTTLVIASHDWQWLYEVCDEILHLFKGRIFGTGRETLAFGPWKHLGGGQWGKPLADGQILSVPEPPDSEAAAAIGDIHIAEPETPVSAAERVLRGTVSRVSLERKTGRIFATIMAGDLSFTIGLSSRQSEGRTIYPGKTVSLHYRPDRIKWM